MAAASANAVRDGITNIKKLSQYYAIRFKMITTDWMYICYIYYIIIIIIIKLCIYIKHIYGHILVLKSTFLCASVLQ